MKIIIQGEIVKYKPNHFVYKRINEPIENYT